MEQVSETSAGPRSISNSNNDPVVSEEFLEDLSSLIQLDMDAAFAYEQAIANIDIEVIRANLESFMEDHEHHVVELSNIVLGLGGTPPVEGKDFKGFLISGFTRVRSASGTIGALKAMKMNEMLTNKMYENALSWSQPEEIREIIESNLEDERHHLQFIEEALQRLTGESRSESLAAFDGSGANG
jgi:rubrerythrin